MKQKIEEAIERNFEINNEEIGESVSRGNTSGTLVFEEGYRIIWELTVSKIEY